MHRRKKPVFKLILFVLGIALFFLGIYYYHYLDLIKKGNQATQESRFDSRDYERAEKNFLASKDLVHYNQGVKAYKAQNLKRAADHFRLVIRESSSSSLKARAYYNLGNILTVLEQPKEAAEMYRAALRLNPSDWETKYNLERLYVFNPKTFGEGQQEASLEQEPRENADNAQNPAEGRGWGVSPDPRGI